MFQTATCAICGAEVDEDVEPVEESIPGETIANRFCSERHRRDYRDRAERDDYETTRERVEHELRSADMDPEAFDDGATGEPLFENDDANDEKDPES